MFAVDGRTISSGQARFPWVGCWTLDATLTGEGPPPPVGSRVAVTLGDIEGVGVVTASGQQVGRAEVSVTGGLAAGWSKVLPLRNPYRNPAGVKLSTVVEDLARDVGERAVVAPGLAATIVGYAWTRPQMLASNALTAIRVNRNPVPWHIRLDGSTWIGERPTFSAPPGVEVIPGEVSPAIRRAPITIPGDAFSAALPGAILDLPGMPPGEPIHYLEIDITSSRAIGVVYMRDLDDLFYHFSERARDVAQYFGLHAYQVVAQVGARVSLRPLTLAHGFHDELAIDLGFGIPGASAVLPRGSVVLLTWRGGNPGEPVVVGYLGTVPPLQVGITASEIVRIGATVPDLDGDPAHQRGVHVGGGSRPVAMGDALETWAPKAHDLLQAVGAAVLGPSAPSVLAELAAYNQASGDGFASTKLGTR